MLVNGTSNVKNDVLTVKSKSDFIKKSLDNNVLGNKASDVAMMPKISAIGNDVNTDFIQIQDVKLPISKQEPLKTSNVSSEMLVNGLISSKIAFELYELMSPRKDIITTLSKNVKKSPAELAKQLGNINNLENAYQKSNQALKSSSILTEIETLTKLATNIADNYYSRQYDNKLKNLNNKRTEKINKLIDATKNDKLSSEKLDNIKQKTVKDFKKLMLEDAKIKDDFNRKKCLTKDIQTGTNFISVASNLIKIRNMVDIVKNPKIISQAVSAFSSSGVASASMVTAVQMGLGLLATGMTIGSLATLFTTVNHFMNSHKKQNNDSNNSTKDNPTIKDNIIAGSEQLASSLGNMIILKNNPAFMVHSLFNWNDFLTNSSNHLKFTKLAMWGGSLYSFNNALQSFKGVHEKIRENYQMKKLERNLND